MNLRYLIVALAILLPGTGLSFPEDRARPEVNPYNVSDDKTTMVSGPLTHRFIRRLSLIDWLS